MLSLRDTRLGRIVLGTLLLLASGLLLYQFAVAAFAATPTAYSWGDGAILEAYTLHARGQLWPLGPYSQFGWHHPGPLLFYALLPTYLLSGMHTIGLNAGALVINVAALLVVVAAIVRWARPPASLIVLSMVAVYLLRTGDLAISYWNPHLVVIPLAAFIVLCAGTSSGRLASLPGVALVASFLAQTHVSLVPIVAALATASLPGLWMSRRDGALAGDRLRPRTWVAATVGVLAIVWWPPVWEELTQSPGNLSRLMRFFAEPSAGQTWTAAFSAWGQAISAVFGPTFGVPTGAALQTDDGWLLPALAVLQLPLLAAAAWDARRRGDAFHASLCWLGIVASLVALWSVTQVRNYLGEYMVFWISLPGALNWAALAASVIAQIQPRSQHTLPARRAARVLAVAIVAWFAASELRSLYVNARKPHEGVAHTVASLAQTLEAHLRRLDLKHPQVRISRAVWGEAAGIVVHLYKRGVAVSVEPEWMMHFGTPLVSRGNEDCIVHIVDADTHAALAKRPGDTVVADLNGVYMHVDAGGDAR